MKKIIIALVLVVFVCSNSNAQKIEVKKSLGENIFYQNGEKLKLSQLQDLMKTNTDAMGLMKSAKTNQIWAMILGGAGGALIGYPIGTAIGGGEANWTLAGAGAALIIGTIPILKGYNRKTKEAVDLYNKDQPIVGTNFNPIFNFNFKGTAMGLSMNF